MKRILAARQDNNGDVLLTGPAIRALAREARVTLLCGPRGEPAARTLPDVADVIVREAAWIDAHPNAVRRADVGAFVDEIAAHVFDEAVIFTSFHQSPLPLALLFRMAGIPRIGAISTDYAGSLLDVRLQISDDMHEVQRNLALVRELGYELPDGDRGELRVRALPVHATAPSGSYVVVHPGCTVPARAWYPERNAALVAALCGRGERVAVTGGAHEGELTRFVCGGEERALDLGGRTSFTEYIDVIRHADAVVCGNTAAAHVASATGTPVVSIFPPTIPAIRFKPWMVPHALLGDQHAPCAGCRVRTCPIEGQPCLDGVTVDAVIDALDSIRLRARAVA